MNAEKVTIVSKMNVVLIRIDNREYDIWINIVFSMKYTIHRIIEYKLKFWRRLCKFSHNAIC